MPPTPFNDLDPLLHQQLRLAVMSVLLTVEDAEFTFLKAQTGATAGNLSVQLSKLEEAGYLTIKKGYNGKVPQTRCALTPIGAAAFEQYVVALQRYLKPNVAA